MARVEIVMGSDSDFPVMRKAVEQLDEFGVEYEVSVASAHRTPDRVADMASSALDRGVEVIIAGAGMAAALPGVIAAHTTVPVIGVPLSGSSLDGVDALYSIVQMPPGIPVATVGIDGARNAAVLAVQLLAMNDAELAERLATYRAQMADGVTQKNENIHNMLD
ncbi:MAG: 5-(carboxyamino)imidazole ribonucleotide mutase [Armatimonadota bacterium]